MIVGDDRALVRAVGLLHRERGLGEGPLALVPVGPVGSLGLARSLGVPQSAVSAARAVLDGSVRMCDLLVDDSDGVVLGSLRIPPVRGAGRPARPSVWSAYRSLVRTLVRPVAAAAGGAGAGHLRLRVEADGVLVADVDQPVEDVSVRMRGDGGPAELVVRTGGGFAASTVTVRAKTVTVSGADFRYRADAAMTGPVRRRTWTLRPGAWTLTLPR